MQDLPFVPVLPDDLPDTMVPGERHLFLKPRRSWKSLEHRTRGSIASRAATIQPPCNDAIKDDVETDELVEKENDAPFHSPGWMLPSTRFSLRPKKATQRSEPMMQAMATVPEERVRDRSEEEETTHMAKRFRDSNTGSTLCVDPSSSSTWTPATAGHFLPRVWRQVVNAPPLMRPAPNNQRSLQLQNNFIPHDDLLPDLF